MNELEQVVLPEPTASTERPPEEKPTPAPLTPKEQEEASRADQAQGAYRSGSSATR